MLAEDKVVQPLYNIFLILWVVSIQSFDQFRFNQTLFVKSLLVFQNLQCHEFLLFVIEYTEYDTKGALTKLLDHLITVS